MVGEDRKLRIMRESDYLYLFNIMLRSFVGRLTILALLVGVWSMSVTPFAVLAQTVSDPDMCPIDGGVYASLSQFIEPASFSDFFTDVITLDNASTYTYAGISLGIGLFRPGETTPAYWTVLPDEYQVPPGVEVMVPFEVSLQAVEPGEYVARVVAKQGGAMEVLGSAIRDIDELIEYPLIKTGPASTAVTTEVEVSNGEGDDEISGAEAIVVEVRTRNEGETPLLNSRVVASIVQGETPLGAAVRAEVEDGVLLVPGRERVTEITDRFLETGKYTVFTSLITTGVLQPVQAIEVLVDGEVSDAAGVLPYVADIAVSEYPLQSDTELIACIDRVTPSEIPYVIDTPLALDLTVSTEGRDLYTSRWSTEDAPTTDHVRFTPGITGADVAISLTLFSERFAAAATIEEGQNTDTTRTIDYTPVQRFSFAFSCPEGEGCEVSTLSDETIFIADQGSSENPNGFWFYAGIVIAAALLMYIMLRRLHPEDDGVPKEVTENELS